MSLNFDSKSGTRKRRGDKSSKSIGENAALIGANGYEEVGVPLDYIKCTRCLGISALIGVLLLTVALIVVAVSQANVVNGGDVRTEELALIISVAPPGGSARRRSVQANHPRGSPFRKYKGPLHPRRHINDVKTHMAGVRSAEDGSRPVESHKMEIALRANIGQFSEKLNPDQRQKLFALTNKMLVETVPTKTRRNMPHKRVLENVHPQFQDATLKELTAPTIQKALDECASRPNVVLCRILLEEGTYKENLHINQLHGGAGYLAGVGSGGLFVEIIGDIKKSSALTFVHGGLQGPTVPGIPDPVAADSFFGQSSAYSKLEFPSASSVRVIQLDINDGVIPLTFNSEDVAQINFADSRAQITAGQPIRIYLPFGFNATSCGVLAAPVIHDAEVVSASANQIEFDPPLPAGIPASIRDGTSFTIMPNVIIEGVSSTEDAELSPPTISVVQNILLLNGVVVRPGPAGTNPNAGPAQAAIQIAHGGQLFAPKLVVDDTAIPGRALVAPIYVSNGGALISTTNSPRLYDFVAGIATESDLLGFISLPTFAVGRSSLVIYGGYVGLGQLTVELNSYVAVDLFYAIEGADPINALDDSKLSIVSATIVASEGGCVFAAGEASVSINRLSCLNARTYGVFAQGIARVLLSNRQQRIRMEPSNFFTGGCILLSDQANLVTGEDPANGFVGTVVSNISQPLQCRYTANCDDPGFPVGALWILHQSRLGALNGINFEGDWNTQTFFGEYVVGDNTNVAVGELFDSGGTFGGSMLKYVTPCVIGSGAIVEAQCPVSNIRSTIPRNITNEEPEKYIGKTYTVCNNLNAAAHTITLDTPRFNCDPMLNKATFSGGKGSCLTFVVSEDGACWDVVSSNGVTLDGEITNADMIADLKASVLQLQICKNSTKDGVSVQSDVNNVHSQGPGDPGCPIPSPATNCLIPGGPCTAPACAQSFDTELWDDADFWDPAMPKKISFPRDGRYAIGVQCSIGTPFPDTITILVGLVEPGNPTGILLCKSTQLNVPILTSNAVYCEAELQKQTANFIAVSLASVSVGNTVVSRCTASVRQIGPLTGVGYSLP